MTSDITREEAIKELSYIADEMPSMECARWIEAINMAIKALEQKPCEDYISRQAAIDALGECPMNWTDSEEEVTAKRDWEDTIKMLKSLPSVTPQSKTGHWILADNQSKEDVENDNYRFICSECRCSDIHAKGTKVPYCWKCGSKMEVEE